MEVQKEKLSEYLKSFMIFKDHEINDFIDMVKYKKLNKNEFFIKEEEICAQVAFVASGIMRSFYYSENAEEITYCFIFPNRFLTAYSSFLRSKPTRENIQAVVDTDLLLISKSNLELLSANNINWISFLKLMAEEQYLELEHRVFQLQKMEAKTKYQELSKQNLEIIKQIPLQYIASYLGISLRHLSRIRKDFQ